MIQPILLVNYGDIIAEIHIPMEVCTDEEAFVAFMEKLMVEIDREVEAIRLEKHTGEFQYIIDFRVDFLVGKDEKHETASVVEYFMGPAGQKNAALN